MWRYSIFCIKQKDNTFVYELRPAYFENDLLKVYLEPILFTSPYASPQNVKELSQYFVRELTDVVQDLKHDPQMLDMSTVRVQ